MLQVPFDAEIFVNITCAFAPCTRYMTSDSSHLTDATFAHKDLSILKTRENNKSPGSAQAPHVQYISSFVVYVLRYELFNSVGQLMAYVHVK